MRHSESIPSTCDSLEFLANQTPAKVAKICAKKNTIKELQGNVFLLAEMKKGHFPFPIYKCVHGKADFCKINYWYSRRSQWVLPPFLLQICPH